MSFADLWRSGKRHLTPEQKAFNALSPAQRSARLHYLSEQARMKKLQQDRAKARKSSLPPETMKPVAFLPHPSGRLIYNNHILTPDGPKPQ